MTPCTTLVAPYLYPVDCAIRIPGPPRIETDRKEPLAHRCSVLRRVQAHIASTPGCTVMGISRALDKTERSAASAVTRLLFYKIIERLEVMQRISRGPRYTYRITI
jgi:hypothetical protein